MAEQSFTEMTFQELELGSELKRAVADMEFVNMTPIQAQAIPVLLSGRDVIGQAQTGTGKTAAFGLPVLEKIDPDNKALQAVILCPTRELAVQAANELRSFAKYMHDVKILPVYGGQDISRQIRALKGVQVIVGTPGRVMDHMRRHTVKMEQVATVILDEADEMLDMGFREDMEVILGAIDHPHQTCLFSATMPQEILNLTDQYQNDPELIRITKKELTIDSIRQYYYPIKHEYKTLALTRLLKFYQYKKCMVFCNTKSMADELSAELQKAGYPADALHGDLTQKQRDSVMGRFRSGSVQILIATDIAARGIDVDDVEAVFNYDIPQESEYYVHRIGRTGRAGREGTSHTLCRSRDFRKLRDIELLCHTTMEERRIPDAVNIREQQEQGTLENILQILNEGHSGRLIPVIRKYCEEHGILPEAFAAACLQKELGEEEITDDTEINLPEKKPSKHSGRHSDRHPGRHFGDRREGHRENQADGRRNAGRDEHPEKSFFRKRTEKNAEKTTEKYTKKNTEKTAEKSVKRNIKRDERKASERRVKDVRRDGSPIRRRQRG